MPKKTDQAAWVHIQPAGAKAGSKIDLARFDRRAQSAADRNANCRTT